MTKEENLPILNWIKEKTRVETVPPDLFGYAFQAGDKFNITLESEHDDLINENIFISISESYKDDVELTKPSYIDVEWFHLQLDWIVIPPAIHPQKDERFTSQEWASSFELDPKDIGNKSYAYVSPDIVCDIIKYCHSLSALKAFW